MQGDKAVEPFRYHLLPGYIFASPEPALVSTVVGACVAVCLWDRRLKIGAMNHFLHPKLARRNEPTPRYGNVSLPAMIRLMVRQGCRREDMEAQIFGGGRRSMHDVSDVGKRNVKMARKILKKNGIQIVSEDVGGIKGRRVLFHTFTSEAIVMKTDKIRRGDWAPYRYRLPQT